MLPESELPSLLMSWMPIGLPIALIFLNTLVSAVMGDTSNALTSTIAFIGNPVIAVGIGVLVAIYGLMPKTPKQEVFVHLEKASRRRGSSCWSPVPVVHWARYCVPVAAAMTSPCRSRQQYE